MSALSDSQRDNRVAAGYDLIGDVHGCADTLVRLLEKLGYQQVQGVYQHKSRRAIFVGDIVDRGPHIREALHLVRAMVDRGSAELVLGNHEYNLLAYCTPGRSGSGLKYLREHSPGNSRLAAETLEQFANYPAEWREFLDWFVTLPLFLEYPGFRVVHACWDQQLITLHRERYKGPHFDLDFLHASARAGTLESQTIQRLTSGIHIPLPEGQSIVSPEGIERRVFRARFWAREPNTYGDLVFQPDPLPVDVARAAIAPEDRERLVFYGTDQPPLFVGHYWLKGQPAPVASNIACLDYSAVKYGRLVAYRMDPEQRQLTPDNFVWVYVDP